MKKLKLNVDKETVRQFFVQNIEKIAFAGFVICFVLIVYKAFDTEPFDNTPDKLNDAANRAKGHWVDDIDVPTAVRELIGNAEVPEYSKLVDPPPVKEDFYKHQAPWDGELFKQRDQRGMPDLHPVEGLRGIAGVGAFEMKPADEAETAAADRPDGGQRLLRAAGKTIRGQRWVVLTGLVPHKEQLDEYVEYFSGCVQWEPRADVPEYIYYRVERAEVTGGRGTGQREWTRFHVKNALSFVDQWESTSVSVVDGKYLIPELVFPLGPLVNPDGSPLAKQIGGEKETLWGPEVAYRPQIPLLAQADEPEPKEGEDIDPGDGPTIDDRPIAPGREKQPPRVRNQKDEIPEFKLFRFFDFSVEPGKSYVYRVRLMLRNPNYGVDDKFLDEEVLAEKRQLEVQGQWQGIETDWSDVTEIVYVPRDTRLLAVSVTPPPENRPDSDPLGKMLAIKWVKEFGRTAREVFRVYRGMVINFPERTYPPSKSLRRPKKDLTEPEVIDSIPVDYVTDALALDMRGGDSSPGEILLLDADGRLVVRNELDDQSEYEKYTAVPEKPPGGLLPVQGTGASGDTPPFKLHDYE